jgi:HD-GYP domain-containing protein (c-di-GMP phosphodiesterase class II)
MNTIGVKDLRAGDCFSKAVFIDKSNIVVPEVLPLKQKDIDRLKTWGIKTLRCEGSLLFRRAAAGTEKRRGVYFLPGYINSPLQLKILKVYVDLLHAVRRVQDKIKNRKPVNTQEINRIILALQDALTNYRRELVPLVFFQYSGDDCEARNAVNTSLLANIMGTDMAMAAREIVELVIAALLHDVGMMRLPQDLIAKKKKLTAYEAGKVSSHTLYSYRIITKELRYPEKIGQAALQHHERWDGEGYPGALAGRRIELYARIIAVADSFEAMISERPYRDPMTGYSAMLSILNDAGVRFDPQIVREFVNCMGVYPLGSFVLLNDSRVGRVVDINPGFPQQPKIKLLSGKNGSPLVQETAGETLQLCGDEEIYIKEDLDPRRLWP